MNTDKLSSLAISDTGFIFDPATGQTYNTNLTGIEIIRSLKAGMEVRQIMDALLDEFDVQENELEVDLMDFIHNLKNYYLIN